MAQVVIPWACLTLLIDAAVAMFESCKHVMIVRRKQT